jgi:hypothetical protein
VSGGARYPLAYLRGVGGSKTTGIEQTRLVTKTSFSSNWRSYLCFPCAFYLSIRPNTSGKDRSRVNRRPMPLSSKGKAESPFICISRLASAGLL